MSAYLIVDVEVHDSERYQDYKRMVPPSLEPYGGRFVVRGGTVESFEGGWQPTRLVVIEFPSMERARAWYDSKEYAEAKALRHATSNARIIAVAGV